MNQGLINGHVNAGCMLFMPDACTGLQKKDTLDCTLYAQLAATKKHSRFAETEQWSQIFLAAMVRFGWVLKSHEAKSLPATDLASHSVWQWVIEQLPPFIPPQFISPVEAMARRSMQPGSDRSAIELFTRHVLGPVVQGHLAPCASTQKVVLQLGMLSASSCLSLVTVSFTPKVALGPDILFSAIKPQDLVDNVVLTFHSMQLMDLVYASLRSVIDDALTDLRPQLLCTMREVDHVL
jgi:hypothetical protein